MPNRILPLATIVATMPATATAQLATDTRFDFRVPAGSLDEALHAYARTTGRQVLYRAATVEGLRTRGFTGSADAEVALAAILQGTGVQVSRPADNVVIVEPGPPQPVIGVVQDDLVITGTNIREAPSTTSVKTLSRREIDRSGRATVADALSTLTANFGGGGNPIAALSGADTTSLNSTVSTAANLRGLGADATLTLFNGRRMAGSGGRGDFTDLSAIPSLAVDRVEVLADGASAIYGSDAVGGVVNILLRRRVKRPEFRLRGDFSSQARVGNALAGFIAGAGWVGGSITAAYDYERRGALRASSRPFTATGDLRPFGGSDRRTFYSIPATILTFDEASGSLQPAFAIPTLPDGQLPSADEITSSANLFNPLAGIDLSPRSQRHSAYLTLEQTAGEEVGLFADLRLTRRNFGYRSPASVAAFAITPANPFFVALSEEPFSLLAYSFFNDLGPSRTAGRVLSHAGTAGFEFSPQDWRLTGSVGHARERSRDRTDNILNASALDEATGTSPDDPLTGYSAQRDGFFNPYGSGRANSTPVLGFLGSGFASLRRSSGLADAVLKADGPVLALPGGPARMAVGVGWRRETFSSGGQTFYSGSAPANVEAVRAARSATALFAEVNVPLIGTANAVQGARSLALSAALRVERYSDFGRTSNPKIGVAWRVAQDLSARANWGTSFRAPALIEINGRRTISPTQLPEADGNYTPVVFVGGGNRRLGPERANTWSAGVTLEPATIRPLRIDLGLFSTTFRERIAQPALDDILRALTDPGLSEFVRRISPGTSTADLRDVESLLSDPNAADAGGLPPSAFRAIIDGRYVNTGRLSVSGMDADVRWDVRDGDDGYGLGLSATWLFRYDVRATRTSASLERLDSVGYPAAFRLRSDVGYVRSGWSGSLFANLVSGYRDDGERPTRPVASFLTLDAVLAKSIDKGRLRGLQVTLSVQNLLGRDPPFVDRLSGLGFDAANATPLGRVLALDLRQTL